MNRKPIEFRGELLTLTELAAKYGVSLTTLRSRLALGWAVEDAITRPIAKEFSSRRAGRPRNEAPKPCPPLREHGSGRAFVRWMSAGKEHFRYFGAFGSREAEEGYKQFMLDWARGLVNIKQTTGQVMVCELVDAYMTHAERYYRKRGKLTSEYHALASASRKLVEHFGTRDTCDFTGDDLRTLQSAWVDDGLTRKTITSYQQRIVRIFRWGTGQTNAGKRPLVPGEVLAQIAGVELLQARRSAAPEPEKVTSVPWEQVQATFPHLHKREERRQVIEDIIRIGWLTGCRPAELLSMRWAEIDRSRPEWRYVPGSHKTEHLEQPRAVWIGPKAQAIMLRYLDAQPKGEAIFALPPTRANQKWWELKPRAFARLIELACIAAGVPHWTPHQLRHSRATEVHRIYESDQAAAAAIGDSAEVTKRVYVDAGIDPVGQRIARETG